MQTSDIIALLALILSAVLAFGKLWGGNRTAAADQAKQEAKLESKLDSIASGVEDIRVDQRAMRERVNGLDGRMYMAEGRIEELRHDVRDLKAYHKPVTEKEEK